jgi:hypothetical protein
VATKITQLIDFEEQPDGSVLPVARGEDTLAARLNKLHDAILARPELGEQVVMVTDRGIVRTLRDELAQLTTIAMMAEAAHHE